MTGSTLLWVLIALIAAAVIIWWAWSRSAKAVDKPTTPSKPASAPEPAAKLAEQPPVTPLAFKGEIPAQEPIEPMEPITAKHEAAPKPAKAKAPTKAAPAAKKAAAPAAKTARAPVAKAAEAAPAKARPAKAPAAKAPAAKPKAVAAKPAAPAQPDNLLQLKGVGPKLVALLNDLGVTSFAQIAGWSAADVERIDSRLGTFKGRISRDKWIEQAGLLAKGDVAGFEAKFGKLDGENR